MPKGLSFDQLFPGTYIRAGEFNGKPVTLTIKSVKREMLSNGAGGEEGAVTVAFEETPKQWVMNKTCGVCLRALWGDDSGEWLGHRVTLHPVKDESGLSESGQCIRVLGSPELQKPLTFRARLGRKMVTQTLQPTGKNGHHPPAFDEDTGEVYEDAEDGTDTRLSGDFEPEASTGPQTHQLSGHGILDLSGEDEPPGVAQLHPPAATKAQLQQIERLVKATGTYEAELAGILDSYGATVPSELSKKSADFVIAALKERG